MGFPRQEYLSGLPFSPLGDLLIPGLEPTSLGLLHWQADSLQLCHLGSPWPTVGTRKCLELLGVGGSREAT